MEPIVVPNLSRATLNCVVCNFETSGAILVLDSMDSSTCTAVELKGKKVMDRLFGATSATCICNQTDINYSWDQKESGVSYITYAFISC